MRREEKRKLAGILLSFLVILVAFSAPAQSYFTMPKQHKVTVGDELKLELLFPQEILKRLDVIIHSDKEDLLKINGIVQKGKKFNYPWGEIPSALQPGIWNLQLRLFGIIPIKSMVVEVMPQVKLTPGGHSIGILLQSQGVLVVGMSPIMGEDGNKSNPARDSGINIGDTILEINGQPVKSDGEVARLINEEGANGQALSITFKHGQEKLQTMLQPVYCKETKRYRVGLFVRDSAAGVGTMTFYDPGTGKYGALGHVINDADTNQKIDVADGKIVPAAVQGIQVGKRGQPGEKIGTFLDDKEFSGNIEKNTPVGIFGHMQEPVINTYYNEPLPIALPNQVKNGEAEILTVINGDKIESFKITIERLLGQRSDGKNMIIRVTDPKLLSLTGGIIQGMSGSPIIQNGRIIGAVTHVFVNDPSRGYGVLIDKMLNEAQIPLERKVSVRKNYLPALFLCFTPSNELE